MNNVTNGFLLISIVIYEYGKNADSFSENKAALSPSTSRSNYC